MKNNINIQNKKANFEYFLLEEFICGIVLFGTEVKSIREGGANIANAYCYVRQNDVYIKNMNISNIKNTKNS